MKRKTFKKITVLLILLVVSSFIFIKINNYKAEVSKPTTLDELNKLSEKEIAKWERYNSNDYGLVTDVKFQNAPICWAYGTTSTLETNALKKKITKYNRDTLFYSAINFARTSFSYDSNSDPLGLNAFTSIHSPSNVAHNLEAPAHMLFQWREPIQIGNSETDVKIENLSLIASNTIGKYGALEKIDDLKEAIAKYGALAVTYIPGNQSMRDKYVKSKLSNESGHVVSIVGWDDTIKKENFRRSIPEHDGAFIVKNSWGKNSGIDGFFYLSYESVLLNAFAYDLVENDEYDNNYYYNNDLLSAPSDPTFEHDSIIAVFPTLKDEYNKDEYIKAVNVAFQKSDKSELATIKIEIFNDVRISPFSKNYENDIVLGKSSYEETRQFKYSGVQTFKLKEQDYVKLEKQKYFAIRVTSLDKSAKVKLSAEHFSVNDLTFFEKDNKFYSILTYQNANLVANIRVFTINKEVEDKADNNLKYSDIKFEDETKNIKYDIENKAKRNVSVYFKGLELEEGKDYDISYIRELYNEKKKSISDRDIIGYIDVEIVGKGNYIGKNKRRYPILIGSPLKYNKNSNEKIKYNKNVNSLKDIKLNEGWVFVFPDEKPQNNKLTYIKYKDELEGSYFRNNMCDVILLEDSSVTLEENKQEENIVNPNKDNKQEENIKLPNNEKKEDNIVKPNKENINIPNKQENKELQNNNENNIIKDSQKNKQEQNNNENSQSNNTKENITNNNDNKIENINRLNNINDANKQNKIKKPKKEKDTQKAIKIAISLVVIFSTLSILTLIIMIFNKKNKSRN